MQVELQNSEVCLKSDVPVRLKHARGTTIRCTTGHVWLTAAGEPTDIFLSAGQYHTLASNRLVLVEALGKGCIRLEAPPRGNRYAAWRRLVDWLFGHRAAIFFDYR
jgi:hypothetical protein